jgi:hypothetical protein
MILIKTCKKMGNNLSNSEYKVLQYSNISSNENLILFPDRIASYSDRV